MKKEIYKDPTTIAIKDIEKYLDRIILLIRTSKSIRESLSQFVSLHFENNKTFNPFCITLNVTILINYWLNFADIKNLADETLADLVIRMSAKKIVANKRGKTHNTKNKNRVNVFWEYATKHNKKKRIQRTLIVRIY